MTTYELFVVHVVRCTGDARVIPPTLPDELQEVVHTWQDVVHEDDRVKVLVLRVAQLMQWHERSVPHLRQVLYSVVERTASTHRGPNGHPHADTPTQRIEYPEERLRLIRRPVLVYRHVHVGVAQNGRHAEEGSEQIWDDVERVVEVDGEEVLVVVRPETT